MNLHEVYLAAQLAKNDNGGTNVDLSEYYTKSQTDSLISGKVDKVPGKGLSTNDFTNADKSKLDDLENYSDTEIKEKLADTVEQTALNRSTLGYQRKNLLLNNCSNKTRNGITATVNDDGSITLNGTNTTSTTAVLYWNMQTGATTDTVVGQYTGNRKWLPNGRYILSSLTAGVYLQMVFSEDNETERRYAGGSNGDSLFEITDDDKYVWTRLRIVSGASFDNVTVYPMIRLAEITDDTYEPYRPSIEERLTALENAILGGNSND